MVQKTSADKYNVIFQTKAIDDKIYIKEQKGFYQSIRRYLSVGLMLLFIVTPFIKYQGNKRFYSMLKHRPKSSLLLFLPARFTDFYLPLYYGGLCLVLCRQ
ncbi:hypothetical protein A9Q98_04485 [Thalassotalea sp. 42_200_T64]|nr:hypothetical protein A9Q98_04485 [Thalassotalea sp. 42_200_T64]